MSSARRFFNIQSLTHSLAAPHFRMKTLKSIRDCLQIGEYSVGIDLQDAYCRIPIAENLQHASRFALHVPVTPVRLSHSTASLHGRIEANGQSPASTRNGGPCLSERLALRKPKPTAPHETPGGTVRPLLPSWAGTGRPEVQALASSNLHVSGSGFRPEASHRVTGVSGSTPSATGSLVFRRRNTRQCAESARLHGLDVSASAPGLVAGLTLPLAPTTTRGLPHWQLRRRPRLERVSRGTPEVVSS
jgi:hypothetical protein